MRSLGSIGFLLVFLSLVTSCDGGTHQVSQGTKAAGANMSRDLRTLAACEDFENTKCKQASIGMTAECQLVIPYSNTGMMREGYENVDPGMSRFCDEWEVIAATPMLLARPKMIELAQEIDHFIGE